MKQRIFSYASWIVLVLSAACHLEGDVLEIVDKRGIGFEAKVVEIDADQVHVRQLSDAKLIMLPFDELSSETVEKIEEIRSSLNAVVVSVHSIVELTHGEDWKPGWGYIYEVRNHTSEVLHGGVEIRLFDGKGDELLEKYHTMGSRRAVAPNSSIYLKTAEFISPPIAESSFRRASTYRYRVAGKGGILAEGEGKLPWKPTAN